MGENFCSDELSVIYVKLGLQTLSVLGPGW